MCDVSRYSEFSDKCISFKLFSCLLSLENTIFTNVNGLIHNLVLMHFIWTLNYITRTFHLLKEMHIFLFFPFYNYIN